MLIILPVIMICSVTGIPASNRNYFNDSATRVSKYLEGACVYHEGKWSNCKSGVQRREDLLSFRQLFTTNCEVTRNFQRSCSSELKERKCLFEKSKMVPWTGCLDVGVTQKVLHLVDSGGLVDCPKQKIISRKCGKHRLKRTYNTN